MPASTDPVVLPPVDALELAPEPALEVDPAPVPLVDPARVVPLALDPLEAEALPEALLVPLDVLNPPVEVVGLLPTLPPLEHPPAKATRREQTAGAESRRRADDRLAIEWN